MPIAKKQDITQSGGLVSRLSALRKEKGETQATFAARLGVPKSTYVAWERGEAEPPFSLLQKILVAFGQRAAFTTAGFALDQNPLAAIDWSGLGRLCEEVKKLSDRAGYDFEVADILEIAGMIYERGSDEFEAGLRDAERLLRIGKGGKSR